MTTSDSTGPVSLQPQAIKAAQARDWPQAIDLNSQILEKDPANLPATKRLAYAYSSTQNYPEALKLYQKALELDKTDPIAKSNIIKLTTMADQAPDTPCDPNQQSTIANNFLKVNEEVKSVQLAKITTKPIWHLISPGIPVEIISSRNGLTANLAQSGQYVGRVRQSSISPTMCKRIIKGKYEAIIHCADPDHIQVLVKITQ